MIKPFKNLLALLAFGFLLSCSNQNENSNVMGNQLANASSPYLREHADNPVHWREWSDEALAEAKKQNKPIIISIGYASCHWCHVMEEETFMDTAVARIMNESFISIKIDREERPDIDQIYINAAQLITGHAGWPLNAFTLPDGKPFYAGTYFPTEQWIDLLKQITKFYKEDYENVRKQANSVAEGVAQEEQLISTIKIDNNLILTSEIFNTWQDALDFENGGLKGAPKFPMPVLFEFLLSEYSYNKNAKALESATITLDAMAQGGIYDHLAGGFARYSTDANWKVPHFEKMLYDNGQLISLYAHAYQVSKNDRYKEVIEQTVDFIKSEMTSPESGFYSSINADTEGEEGKFYVWTKDDIEKNLDPKEISAIEKYYNITETGNWENGKNVLFTSVMQTKTQDIQNANTKLLAARNTRVHPTIDDKILTSWNALMIIGLIDTYWALNDEKYLEVALKDAEFISQKMLNQNGKLWRSYSTNKASIDGFLDDYALLATAFIKLYEATFDITWLQKTKQLADYTIQHFKDLNTPFFFYTSDESQKLIARKIEIADQVIPSSNSVLAEALYKLGHYFENESYLNLSQGMAKQITSEMIQNGPYYANWARLIGLIKNEPYEVAVVGSSAKEMSKKLMTNYLPNVILLGGDQENLPLLENKLVEGKTIIYVCKNKVCKLPVQEVDQALIQIHDQK